MQSASMKGNTMERKKVFDDAESVIKAYGCSIQTFLTKGKVAYVLSKEGFQLSPDFPSLYQLCAWVNSHQEEISQ
jgi:hypothetical protein